MVKDFDQFQAMTTYKTWEKEFNHSSYHQVNQRLTQDATLLREELLSTTEYSQKGQQKSLHFTQTALQDIADNCLEFNHIVLTNKVIYVKDISKVKSTPFNTLIFYLNQHPIKSMETTTEIMNRYFESNLVSYQYIKLIGRSIGIKKCCPYVYNDIVYVPEKGPTNAAVSWYAMHHVLFAIKSNQSKLTFLHFRNQDELSFDLGKKGYENQLERVINLYSLQQLFKKRVMSDFNLIEVAPLDKELNVIQKRLQTATPVYLEPHSLQRFLNYLLYFKVQELLTKVLGEENPFIEEIMSTFKKPPFRFRFQK
ncbi:competence protein ComK [Carnobacterium funditum]|uniref:competence protein ComK n=1 Tax=Carnobacterium funditum TaxID=2752 RepID=UPI000556F5CD|nr:competence protein ComK [Carnobacterium funditum]